VGFSLPRLEIEDQVEFHRYEPERPYSRFVSFFELFHDVRLAGAASKVGSMCRDGKDPRWKRFPLMTAGQRMKVGTRHPPSQLVVFFAAERVEPPSGQLKTSAPLSVEYITIVLLAMPRSSIFLSNWPTVPVMLDHTVG